MLLSTAQPPPGIVALCEQVCVRSSPLALLLHAERTLRHRWVAISVGVWGGARRQRLLKWAPFLIPPFRVLLLNGNGDFLPGTPRHVLAHGRRLLHDRVCSLQARSRLWLEGARAAGVRRLLRYLGKRGTDVAVVFGPTPESCEQAVVHLRNGAPEVPIFLFSTAPPHPDTAALCERVCVRSSSLALLLDAERTLWRRWVTIGVGVWSGARRQRLLKWAPFLIPPFRVLLLNGNGDFLPGTPRPVLVHGRRMLHDRVCSLWHGVRESAHSAADGARGIWGRAIHLALLAVAGVLRAAGYPHRRWFPRMHGEGVLHLSPEHSSATGVAVFAQTGEHWDGAALERFARSTGARWILWQRRDRTAGSPGDLIAPFLDPKAFAVSRQPGFRAWKPALLVTAPFRTLQPGEASQVLAPIAPSILVDRRKLLALGIPRCRLAETAWMLCFWKAASAGWRSFSVGQEQPLAEEPDFPVQETEFLFRLLADRTLRSLGPAEPELARGSVAFAPSLRPAPLGEAGRLKVLLVTPFLPFPLSHGGAVRIYNLCRALAGRVDFVLITLREKGEVVDYPRLREIFREVYVVDIDERASGDADLPEQVRRTQSQPLRALIAGVSRRWNPDVLQIEYTHMAHFRESAPEVPAILVEHDLTFSLYRQLAQERPSQQAHREFHRWLKFERRWLADYDGVWTVSPADCRDAMTEGCRSRATTFLVPNGVDVRRYVPCAEPAAAPEILYVGSFRHLPNVLGFDNLCREVMPRVWSRLPAARLRVVAGKDFERYWSGTSDPRIELHGFVENLRPLYARALVAVAPLGSSAGTNIKVLEAMACGKAVVSTPAGCAGLGLRDGVDGLIRTDWDEFAAALCGLLVCPEERARIGEHARQTAEARFSWDAIAEDAYRSYLAMADRGGAATAVGRAAVG
ncbi:MAG: glycosyltransferase family 4 protein [Candidatus Sulfopaludibacter sp.]|nr:glycosyltransferase family 4 protein [Candidatus Sulfopaludibacter sp.]